MERKRKNRKHSIQEKKNAVELYTRGYGCTSIGKQLKVGETQIKHWIRSYQELGVKGFENLSHSSFSSEIKCQAVRAVLEKFLTFETVALKYNVSSSAVYSWTQKVKLHGYEVLTTIKQGRPPKAMERPKKKVPETELEKLQEEVRYLKAENAYLKKLRVLVQERVARESGKQPRPSKD
jgi:transposase